MSSDKDRRRPIPQKGDHPENESKHPVPEQSGSTVAKPNNDIAPDDPLGKPKEGQQWTREAMDMSMRKPQFDGPNDPVKKDQVEKAKK